MKKLVLPVLIFLIPSQVGYHLWPDFAYVFGIRVDYLSPTIYLTDVLIILLFIFWATAKPKIERRTIFWIIAFSLFATVNVSFAKSTPIAIYKWIKIFELLFFGYYIFSIKKLDIKKQIILPLTASILFFSLLGILQFFKQGALGGPLYFLGERSFSATSAGIALVDIGGSLYLRAYSTFSHPNSFAGFLLVGLILVFFSKEKRKLKALVFSLGVAALLLTFSLGALTGLIVILLFYLLRRISPHIFKKILIALTFLAVFLSLALAAYSKGYTGRASNLPEEFLNRLVLAAAAGKIFSTSPVWGVGLNNFVVGLGEIKLVSGVTWWLQPVHNIFLLVLTETGILGLLMFAFLLVKASSTAAAKGKIPFGLALIFIVVTGVVDHYWLTLQQNQLLASLVLGLVFKKS